MRFRAAALLITIIISAGLNSCAYFSPLAEFSCGDYTCRLYGTVSVKQIKVTAGEKTIASFKTEGAAAGAPDYGFIFVDANFDGSYDICLAAFYGEEGTRYSFWLWDPVSKAFSTDKTLDSLLSPVFDSSTKTISAQYKKHTVEPTVGTEPETYIDEEGTVTYEWRQGALAAIKKECITYYSESEIYCVAVWDINAGGELEPTEEHWLMPDQYARAGYKPLG
jgi:hypothetical protein